MGLYIIQRDITEYHRIFQKLVHPRCFSSKVTFHLNQIFFSGTLLCRHIHIDNKCGKKVKHNDDFNERTNTLLYKNIPLTLYSRMGCERVVKGLVLIVCENWPNPSVAPGYIIVWHPPASCELTHLHRIQPRPQVKVIFRYLRADAPVSAVPLLIYAGASLNWRLSRGSICYNIMK